MTGEATELEGHVNLLCAINDFKSRAFLLYALANYMRLVPVLSTFRQRDFMSEIR